MGDEGVSGLMSQISLGDVELRSGSVFNSWEHGVDVLAGVLENPTMFFGPFTPTTSLFQPNRIPYHSVLKCSKLEKPLLCNNRPTIESTRFESPLIEMMRRRRRRRGWTRWSDSSLCPSHIFVTKFQFSFFILEQEVEKTTS